MFLSANRGYCGYLIKQFAPKLKIFDTSKIKSLSRGVGGTIGLRHWWSPKIKGMLSNAEENTVRSTVDKIQHSWIGFNDLSRSIPEADQKGRYCE